MSDPDKEVESEEPDTLKPEPKPADPEPEPEAEVEEVEPEDAELEFHETEREARARAETDEATADRISTAEQSRGERWSEDEIKKVGLTLGEARAAGIIVDYGFRRTVRDSFGD